MTRPRILVAEDALINQRVTRAMLAKLGFEADVVANGQEAVSAISRATYGAILMDCRMPVMDGYQATATIRQTEGANRHIPIIALTASAVVGVREGCIAAGMDDYLTKPVRSDELERVLSRWIGTDSSGGTETADVEQEGDDELVREPIVDPDNIAQIRELGDDIVAELAGIFLTEAPNLRQRLGDALDEADSAQVHFVAHRLRSNVRTWGARRLDRVLNQIEEIGASGSVDGARALTSELDDALAEVIAAIVDLEHPGAKPARV